MTVLSVGGACLEVSGSFPVDSAVELRFTLPGFDEDIACGGVVRHEEPGHGVGVEFTDLAPSDRERIREVVQAWLVRERALCEQ